MGLSSLLLISSLIIVCVCMYFFNGIVGIVLIFCLLCGC